MKQMKKTPKVMPLFVGATKASTTTGVKDVGPSVGLVTLCLSTPKNAKICDSLDRVMVEDSSCSSPLMAGGSLVISLEL